MASDSPVLEQAEVVMSSRIDELPRVIACLDDLVGRHRLPDAALDMHVALDEVLTNIVKYAYQDAAAHEIRVRLTVTPRELKAEIEDDGRAFNPLRVERRAQQGPLSHREPGGLGVKVVKHLMNHVAYMRVHDRNRLTLVRRLDR